MQVQKQYIAPATGIFVMCPENRIMGLAGVSDMSDMGAPTRLWQE